MAVIYVTILTYVKPLEEIDAALSAHIEWLNKNYDDGVFIASGRRIPRNGGVILAKGECLEDITAIMQQDPFHLLGLATHEIFPFEASKAIDGLSAIL